MTLLRDAASAVFVAFAPWALADDLPVLAHENGILIQDAYARAAGASARTGAAFMSITNEAAEDDTLVAARSDAAQRVELHGHTMENGIARMREVEDGIPLPAGETVLLERGGLHVMFMGLTESFAQDDTVAITFVFKNAGEIRASVPVDLGR